MNIKINHIWIFIWTLTFIIGLRINCIDTLGNKGINIIQNEYYRFFSGLLVHGNLIHLIVNIITLYFSVNYLYEQQIDQIKLLVFSIIVGIGSNIIFSMIYRNSTSVGGSPIIFAMFGLILALQIMNKNVERFTLETLQTRWLLGYAILGNIPFFSKNISAFVIHFTAFMMAFVLGCIGIKLL